MIVISLITFITLITIGQSQLSVEGDINEVKVFYHGVLIIDHTPSSPFSTIGTGNAIFEELTGNFEITQNVTSRVNLTVASIQSSYMTESIIIFETEENDNIRVELNLTVVSGPVRDILNIAAKTTIPENSRYNRLWCRFHATPEEKVYGAGEQYTYFNLRNHTFPIWSREQGVGRDGGVVAQAEQKRGKAGGCYHTTYWPQANFLSNRRYSLFVENYEYQEMNFENPNYHEIFLHTMTMEAKMFWAPTIPELVTYTARDIGFQKPLPDWIMSGTIIGIQRGTDEMMKYYEIAKEAGINVSAIWIQDWSGYTATDFGYRVYWNWKWNDTMYPGLDQKIVELGKEGVKIAVYCTPNFIVGSELFVEAEEKGFLMTDENGDAFKQDFMGFHAGTVDIMYEDAANWYKEKIKENIIALGIRMWMADFSEYTRTDMYSKNTSLSHEEIHNIMPVKWAEINSQVVEETNTSDTSVYFMRAGGYRSSAYQVLAWAGDQNVDFSYGDGVATTITAALSLAVSGMGVTHFDIGGYTTITPYLARTQELFLRSAEYAVFTPVMRTHEGNKPDVNHQFYSSNDTLTKFARLTHMHSVLFPYTKSLSEENSRLGTPVQRPMFYHYENDPVTWDIKYQYMYGRDLIVAPVINEGQMEVEVYLPGRNDDQWVHLFMNDGPHSGPITLNVSVPMGYPAVFYRVDSSHQSLFEEVTEMFGYTPE